MNKEQLLAMAVKYDEKAEKAYLNHQETGITRYDREHRKNSEMADIIRMAANAADEHTAYLNMRFELSRLAWMAKEWMVKDCKNPEKIAKELLSTAVLYGLIQRDKEVKSNNREEDENEVSRQKRECVC